MNKIISISTKDYTPLSYKGEYYHKKYDLINCYVEYLDKTFTIKKILKYTRPLLPPFFRLIAPARWAKQRITKKTLLI